jgi:hypothetical protein
LEVVGLAAGGFGFYVDKDVAVLDKKKVLKLSTKSISFICVINCK